MAGKLTQRDRNNIILRFKRNKKISDLAKRYEVSRQTISHLIHEYQKTGSIPQEKKAGRKRVELSEAEKELIRNSLNECHMKADRLEVYIRKKLEDVYLTIKFTHIFYLLAFLLKMPVRRNSVNIVSISAVIQ